MSYLGNAADPTDKTPHLVRYEAAKRMVESGQSVILGGQMYHAGNFDKFPKDLGFALLSDRDADAQREQIRRQIERLQSEERALDEAQATPVDQRQRLGDLMKSLQKRPVNVPAGTSTLQHGLRESSSQAAASASEGAGPVEDEARLMSGEVVGRAPEQSQEFGRQESGTLAEALRKRNKSRGAQ